MLRLMSAALGKRAPRTRVFQIRHAASPLRAVTPVELVSSRTSALSCPREDQLRGARDIFSNDVGFEIHAIAGGRGAQIRVIERIWNDLHVEPSVLERRNRQTDSV